MIDSVLNTEDFDLGLLNYGPNDYKLGFVDQTSPNLEVYSCSLEYAASYLVRTEYHDGYTKQMIEWVQYLMLTDPTFYEYTWVERSLSCLFVTLRMQSQKAMPAYFFIDSICDN